MQIDAIRHSTNKYAGKRKAKSFPWIKFTQKAVIAEARHGMTLPELLISVAILALISAIAIPKYLNTINATRQKDTANQISNIQATIMAYREEFLKSPASWQDLSSITPISTYDAANNRSTATGDLSTPINPDKYYTITITRPKLNIIQITGIRKDTPSQWMIQACLATETGVSDMELSSGSLTTATVSCE